MNLRKLPPSLVLALGLGGCVQSSTCLSYDPTSADTETTSATGTAGSSGSTGESDVGPCLGMVEPETGTTSGTTGTSTGDGSSSDGGSSSDTGGDSSGGALDEPPSPEHARQQALRRLLSRGILPADVAASLRERDQED